MPTIPHWQQNIAARSAIRIGFYRPGRSASRIQCPLLVLAYRQDGVAPPQPAMRAAQRAARGSSPACPEDTTQHSSTASTTLPKSAFPSLIASFFDRELGARSGGTTDQYIAGGEPGVVVRRPVQIESIEVK